MPNAEAKPFVLIVEDEFLIALDIESTIRELGYEVEVAPDLDQALSLARQARVDLALIDINLSGVKSFPVAAVLREQNVPFAFLTGYDKAAVPEEFMDVPVLRKPFFRNDLHATLRRLGAPDR